MIRVLDSAGSTLVEWGRQQQHILGVHVNGCNNILGVHVNGFNNILGVHVNGCGNVLGVYVVCVNVYFVFSC